MSEKKQSFMQELDLWTEANIVAQLVSDGDEQEEVTDQTVAQVKHAIREKVLESYKNGLRAGTGAVRKEIQSRTAR